MSSATEKSSRPPKSSSSNPAPPGDHRKRRRNRTTQSCLNCHASKRMCDRKRPACQRCTTLGLTGLCVYEVDDPSQRNNLMDEKVILRGRIAELEGVIREMKNKPHPRWAQRSPSRGPPSSPTSEQEMDVPVASGSDNSHQDITNTPPMHTHSVKPRPPQLTLPGVYLSPVSPTSTGSASSCESLLSPLDFNYLSACNGLSPSSSSSNSPMPEHPSLPRVMVNDVPLGEDHSQFNMETLLAATHLEEGLYGHMLDQMMQVDRLRSDCAIKDHVFSGRNCGCINDHIAYTNILELSARLRRAVEALGRVSDHEHGTMSCELYARMTELDALTSAAIGSTLPPSERLSTQSMPLLSAFPSPTAEHYPHISSHAQASQMTPGVSTSLTVNVLPQWDERPPFFDSPVEDSFMSWDARQQRQDWPQQQQQHPPLLI